MFSFLGPPLAVEDPAPAAPPPFRYPPRRGAPIARHDDPPARAVGGEAVPPPVSISSPVAMVGATAGRVVNIGESSAKARRDNVATELALDKLRQSRGELCEIAEVEMVLSAALAELSGWMQRLPDLLCRQGHIAKSALPEVARLLDEQRTAFLDQIDRGLDRG